MHSGTASAARGPTFTGSSRGPCHALTSRPQQDLTLMRGRWPGASTGCCSSAAALLQGGHGGARVQPVPRTLAGTSLAGGCLSLAGWRRVEDSRAADDLSYPECQWTYRDNPFLEAASSAARLRLGFFRGPGPDPAPRSYWQSTDQVLFQVFKFGCRTRTRQRAAELVAAQEVGYGVRSGCNLRGTVLSDAGGPGDPS